MMRGLPARAPQLQLPAIQVHVTDTSRCKSVSGHRVLTCGVMDTKYREPFLPEDLRPWLGTSLNPLKHEGLPTLPSPTLLAGDIGGCGDSNFRVTSVEFPGRL